METQDGEWANGACQPIFFCKTHATCGCHYFIRYRRRRARSSLRTFKPDVAFHAAVHSRLHPLQSPLRRPINTSPQFADPQHLWLERGKSLQFLIRRDNIDLVFLIHECWQRSVTLAALLDCPRVADLDQALIN
ncbi:hypothetical protein ElyMa_000203100 [Elysia marginata]|uniref:Uncharacterized protein n=1 Tax=Elysia marginata TaxID=1093978 RepID=A0AAV4EYB1_9GAST|nr:hypothetical protein ElyMa_000203100 [Elysia marginata]